MYQGITKGKGKYMKKLLSLTPILMVFMFALTACSSAPNLSVDLRLADSGSTDEWVSTDEVDADRGDVLAFEARVRSNNTVVTNAATLEWTITDDTSSRGGGAGRNPATGGGYSTETRWPEQR